MPAYENVYEYKVGKFLRLSVHDFFNLISLTQAIHRVGTK